MKALYSDLSKKGPIVTDAVDISNSVENILSTKKGERIFDRNFGSHIEDYLFEPYSFATSRFILADVKESLSIEPRVEILSTTAVDMDPRSRTYNLVLNLKIKATGENLQINKQLKVK